MAIGADRASEPVRTFGASWAAAIDIGLFAIFRAVRASRDRGARVREAIRGAAIGVYKTRGAEIACLALGSAAIEVCLIAIGYAVDARRRADACRTKGARAIGIDDAARACRAMGEAAATAISICLVAIFDCIAARGR